MPNQQREPLELIVAEMRSWAESGDAEVAHAKADGLLLAALERLAPYATETVDEGWVPALIEAWTLIEKWYA